VAVLARYRSAAPAKEADEKGNPTGLPMFLAGTVNSLVAYGNLTSGNQFHCLDTTNASLSKTILSFAHIMISLTTPLCLAAGQLGYRWYAQTLFPR